MRLTILPLAALTAFAFGCNKSPEGGTAGTKSSFQLSLPTAASTTTKPVKQGTSETFDASLDRGSDFKKDVKLTVEAPKELEVTLNKQEIKASDGDTKFSIVVKAAKDAPIAEHTIKITGKPADGSPTTGEFKVKVTAP